MKLLITDSVGGLYFIPNIGKEIELKQRYFNTTITTTD